MKALLLQMTSLEWISWKFEFDLRDPPVNENVQQLLSQSPRTNGCSFWCIHILYLTINQRNVHSTALITYWLKDRRRNTQKHYDWLYLLQALLTSLNEILNYLTNKPINKSLNLSSNSQAIDQQIYQSNSQLELSLLSIVLMMVVVALIYLEPLSQGTSLGLGILCCKLLWNKQKAKMPLVSPRNVLPSELVDYWIDILAE